MKTLVSWIIQFAVIAALGFATFLYFTQDAGTPATESDSALLTEATLNLPVATLKPQVITPQYTSLAKVELWQSSTLASEATGRVVWVCECFEEGQIVPKGTALLRIDATSYQRDIVDREKDLSTARANYTTAQAETEQARENYARLDLGEPNDIVLKIPELTAARLAVDSSEAALAIAERNLAETTVIAPYSGIISATGVVLGDLVGNGANLGTLTGTELFRVRFPILESQIALAQVGSEITIETTTQPVITKIGIVKAIDIDIEAETRLNAVIVAVQAPLEGDILRLGRFVNGAFIGTPLEDVFAIPLSAVNNDGNYFLIGPDSRLISTMAIPVYRDFQAIYVAAEGLSEIEIVIGNALGLRGGMLVKGYAQ